MKLFGEVKCGRCDRRYSALRSKCPYCGAGRGHSAKRPATVNKGVSQLIAGVILLVLIVAAVILLIIMSLKLEKGSSGTEATINPDSIVTDEDVSTVGGENSEVVVDIPEPEPESEPEPEPELEVMSLSLNYQDVSVFSGSEQLQLKATVLPTDAAKYLTWTSSDPSVAVVDENGLVVGVDRGDATITCTVGDKSASCIVRVRFDAPAGSVATSTGGTMTLSHTDVTISYNETFTLSVSGTDETPSFSSGNSGIASVDSNGVVKGISSGKTTITVTVGSSNFECIVRVR